jgi:eukaryotic-like serine/threonine-protein kinase
MAGMGLPDPARWRALDTLVEQALELPEDARLDWLAAQAVDESLRADALRLLRAAGEAPSWLSPPAQARIGQRIGAWRIVRELGRGGMGVVYLGEREDGQFRQRAAIKLLSAALASDARRARFLAERQLLAELEHPSIARLIEGGTTEDALPWFALEFVDGEPLVEDARRRGLDRRARLELFLQVCEVVRFAHSRLVVHRDLKPGNILVTPEGQVKLLDFGIAKLLDTARSDATHELRPLTPAYAAPEQHRGETVTVATDVWSLGVLLCELLTGRRPFQAEDGAEAAALSRAVLEQAPRPPSQLVGGDEARALRGDIDTIVLRCLAKEPERRYSSVEALAEDVQRHLDLRPIRARPDDLGYRLGRFLRRHRPGVAAAVLVLAALSAAGVGLWWQAERARAEANRAELVKEFLVGLFAQGDPDLSQGQELRARELLEEGERRVEAYFAGEPRLSAEFRALLGGLYLRLGEVGRAQELLAQAAAESEQAFGPRASQTLLAHLDLAEAQLANSQYEAAEAALVDWMALAEASGPAAHARARALLGEALRGQSRYVDAEASLRTALDIDREAGGERSEAVARDLYYLGGLALGRGEYDQAKSHLEEALSIFRSDFGGESTRVAQVLRDLGSTSVAMGDQAQAERLLRQSHTMYLRLLGPEHPTVAHTATLLAALLRETGQLGEAETLLRQALAVHRARFGEAHARSVADRHQLALVLLEKGRLDEAAAEFDTANRLAARGDVPDSLRVALQIGRGALALAQADFAGAEQAYRAAVQEFGEPAEVASPALALAWRGAGLAALLQDRAGEAVDDLRRAADAYARLPAADPNRLLIGANLAQALAVDGRGEEALRVLREPERASAELPPGHRLRGLVLQTRLRAELAAGRIEPAQSTRARLAEAAAQPYAAYAELELALLDARLAAARGEARTGCTQLAAALPPETPPLLRREHADARAACAP